MDTQVTMSKNIPVNSNDHSLLSEYVSILSIPVNKLTINELTKIACDWIDTWPEHRRPYYICTVNTDFLVNAIGWTPLTLTHPELYQCLLEADLSTADGMPLVWFSAICGFPLPERVSGIDLIYRLAEQLSKKQQSIFLLGGQPEVTQSAADELVKLYPGLRIAGMYSQIVDLENDEQSQELVNRINASKPDLLLLNLGNPKQELWFRRVRDQLKIPLAMGVGGAFSFLGHRIQRAPQWMQKMGLEWLYRLSREPKRLWKRYSLDIIKFNCIADYAAFFDFFYRTFSKWIGNSRKTEGEVHVDSSTYEMVIPSNLQEKNQYRWFHSRLEKGLDYPILILDFTHVSYCDIRYLGLLVHATAQADRRGIKLQLKNLSSSLKFYFYVHHAWELLEKHTG